MIRKVVKSDFQVLSKYYKEFDDSGVDLFKQSPFSLIMIYELENEIVGFINYSIIYDRAELDYIYVDKEYRGKKIASELLQFCLDDVTTSGCTNITLEVNENNTMGIGLYKKFGFQQVAKRSRYYHGVDALLMVRDLK